jgi:hypothetical protein
MATTIQPLSYQIYKSRDQIRNQLVSLMKEYLELENLDPTKSSIISYFIEILSTLTSNLLFYQISTYKEFFLTKAQLPESVYNLATFLGYNTREGSPASVNVMFTMPLTFTEDTQIILADGYKVSADNSIFFSTYYTTTINIIDANTSNPTVRIVIVEDNEKVYNMPVDIDSEESTVSFVLPFRQYKEIEQEFKISDDLRPYQFVSLDVPFVGKLSSIAVTITPPNSVGEEIYTEYSSLFLMDENTKGFVSKRVTSGVQLSFGNGLIGYQPPVGSKVRVILEITEGTDGNVISGSIKTGERIYTTSGGVVQQVQFEVINPSPAINGADEESLEEIRRNAIANITALERLVTENDFINTSSIIDNSPLSPNSLPVLKRSDLKTNEISLFSTVLFNNEIVPTRNLFYSFDDTYVPRQTVIPYGGDDYYTLFDMEIDEVNTSAAYTYIMYEIQQTPTLVTSYGLDYNFYLDIVNVRKAGSSAVFVLGYQTTEDDPENFTCEMEITKTGSTYEMINDSTANMFILIIPNYRVIPKGEVIYQFSLKHLQLDPEPSTDIGQYTATFIFRQDLTDFAMSNVVSDSTASYIIYDIPTVKKSYYDGIVARDFESSVLQRLLSTLTFKDYKMTTDFINFKFANTTGIMQNMQLNKVDIYEVVAIVSTPPNLTTYPDAIVGDRYIIRNGTGRFLDRENYIAVLSSINLENPLPYTFTYIAPKTEQMVYVVNKGKKYIMSDTGWIVPEYDIPLQIELDVFKDTTYTGSRAELANSVREALITAFSSRFGINISLYRSEIIDVVQEVEGVEHCRLIKPESSIFFNFELQDLTQDQLLQYGPEYVYFDEDSITVRIY